VDDVIPGLECFWVLAGDVPVVGPCCLGLEAFKGVSGFKLGEDLEALEAEGAIVDHGSSELLFAVPFLRKEVAVLADASLEQQVVLSFDGFVDPGGDWLFCVKHSHLGGGVGDVGVRDLVRAERSGFDWIILAQRGQELWLSG
jgi:hypothetical protein